MDGNMLEQLIERYEMATFSVNRSLHVILRDRMPAQLTIEQYGVLRYIESRQLCHSSDLAEFMCVGKSAITAIVTRLVDKGLVGRKPDDRDRRMIWLYLTPEGKRMVADCKAAIGRMLAGYIGYFEEKEALGFIETYEKLAAVMAEDERRNRE
ncbi:MarR family transcriptional regulator [Paenibacillus cisolokensis]|mgnify:CR=1 FL=1|jgi:Transcriptional regulators|uniref:MarR family transcriptional regulator n=1 Tax=Paenibacillus cisolokensis TaxID=1658519 RepID=UPI003D2769FC